MKKFKIAIVSGDTNLAIEINQVVGALGYESFPQVTSYAEAMELILKNSPDFIIISDGLKGNKQGKDLFTWLNERLTSPFFFIGNYNNNEGIQLIHRDKQIQYINYPLQREIIQKAIHKAVELCHTFPEDQMELRKGQLGDFSFFKEGNTYYRLEYENIFFVESRENYLKIFSMGKNTLVVRATMKEFLELFERRNFLRISRSHIVQVEHIEKLNSTHVFVNGNMLPIGKTYKDHVFKTLGLKESGISVLSKFQE